MEMHHQTIAFAVGRTASNLRMVVGFHRGYVEISPTIMLAVAIEVKYSWEGIITNQSNKKIKKYLLTRGLKFSGPQCQTKGPDIRQKTFISHKGPTWLSLLYTNCHVVKYNIKHSNTPGNEYVVKSLSLDL